MLNSVAMAYAAWLQKLIYDSGPCYTAPLKCDAALMPGGKYAPNNVHIALQTPAYSLIGISEIFASVTGLEYAFMKAPSSMKSVIMSVYLLTNAVGAILGIALSPFAVDPELVWLYAGLGIACFIAGVAFWLIFRKMDDAEEEMDESEQYGDKAVPADQVVGKHHEEEDEV